MGRSLLAHMGRSLLARMGRSLLMLARNSVANRLAMTCTCRQDQFLIIEGLILKRFTTYMLSTLIPTF